MSLIDGIIAEEKRYASIPYTETGDNHQIFSDIVNSYGLNGCQNQPWCATYQFALELQMCGREAALRHWNMSPENYVGYNCFSTEAAFQRAGRTGKTPRVGALVIFSKSHMGRVLSVSGSSFTCGEGNTSNKQYDRNGDSCAVKTYANNDPGIRSFCYIDYEDGMTVSNFLSAVRAVYEMAHNGGYKYGDSHGVPPCSDGIISCDRLVARALWNLGYQDQPKGGITVLNMENYLLAKGLKKITDPNALNAGDIVLMKQRGTVSPTADWHTFVLTMFASQANISKYDMGSQERIKSYQPFTLVPLNQWPGSKEFYCAFRIDEARDYVFTPSNVKMGTDSLSAYLATEILMAYNLKGVKANGKLQPLQLDTRWTKGDMAALTQWKLDRIRNGDANLCKGPYGAGEIGPGDWVSILCSELPFRAQPVPDKQKEGPSVLLLQRILKANKFVGPSGSLALDAVYGPETEYAIKKWQSAKGRPQTGRFTFDDWQLALRSI